MDGIAEIGVENIHVSPIPGDLDRVPDGALHPRGGGPVLLGDGGIQALRNRVDDLLVFNRHEDRVP